MKCSKCGEECRENQAFCFRCGAPIQVMPDFNLIEAELANSVGELLENDGLEESVAKDNDELDFLEDEYYTANENTKQTNVKVTQPAQNVKESSGNKPAKKESSGTHEAKKEKKIFKIKVAIFSVVAVVIVVLGIFLLQGISKSGTQDTFTTRYNRGYDYYSKQAYKEAIVEFEAAKKLFESNADKIKVNKSMLVAYEKIEGSDDKIIAILKELIELEPKEEEHYEALAKVYDKNGMVDELDAFIDSITDVTIAARLSDYIVPLPQFSQQEGTYDKYISIKLTTTGTNTIYYTIDGSNPTTESPKYTEEIKLDEQGTYTIKAFSVNEKGVSSKIVSKNYEINPGVLDAPVVTPLGGTYTEATKISIDVPKNAKCYYVYGDVPAVPTATDTEYTEEIDMLRGKHILSVILIDANGKVSEVTQNVYQLDIPRAVDYNNALVFLEMNLTQNNIIRKDENGDFFKGEVKVRFSYNSIAVIENNEYFIINFESLGEGDVVTATEYYGVDTVTGGVVKLIVDTENAGAYKLTE
jgi:tetratricopeptide (TPR) repeat protein